MFTSEIIYQIFIRDMVGRRGERGRGEREEGRAWVNMPRLQILERRRLYDEPGNLNNDNFWLCI